MWNSYNGPTSDLSKMMQLCGHSPKLVDVDLSEGDLIETRNPSIPFGLWSPQVCCFLTGVLWGGFGLLICGLTNPGFISGKGLQQTWRSFEHRLCRLSTMTSVLGMRAISLTSMAKGSLFRRELLISPLHCWNELNCKYYEWFLIKVWLSQLTCTGTHL